MDTLIPVYNLYSTFLHFLQCGCCFSDYLIVIFELLRTGITLIFKLRLSCVARAVSLGLRLSANILAGHLLMIILAIFILNVISINVFTVITELTMNW